MSLESILDTEPVKDGLQDKKYFNRIKTQIKKVVNNDKIRQYLAPLFGLAIGITNWNKDFGAFKTVTSPLLYKNVYESGSNLYLSAYLSEMALILGYTLFSKNKKENIKWAGAYEALSTLNYYLFSIHINGNLSTRDYGIIWNDVFFFMQIPLFAIMSLNYIGYKLKNRKQDEKKY